MKCLRRQDVLSELQFSLPVLLGAARTYDEALDKEVAALEKRYTVRASASDAALCKLLKDACAFARRLWEDAEEDEDLSGLFALEGRLLQEERWAESVRREGMKQTRLW